MKKNLPVTDNERLFSASQKLISSTDSKGRITHCNQEFEEISGFTREELIGKPHNVVRHPDMPQEVFENMWSYLKAGRPCMGMVKNRSKNGDYYWVNAYVTPITENDEVVGYESVRSCPTRVQVDRAEKIYKRIRHGKATEKLTDKVSVGSCLLMILLLISITLFASGFKLLSEIALASGVVSFAVWQAIDRRRLIRSLAKFMGKTFTDPLAAKSYTDDIPELGQLKVSMMAQIAHLDTVLTRLGG